MCGIVGQVNIAEHINEKVFNSMRDTLQHRGPDGAGTEFLRDGKVALGHRRLSIIDLSEAGKQPMSNEDGSVWVTFNGEIYNFQVIRAELEKKGHHFKSHTDTEILVHGYEEWGTELLHRIKGMYAFAIWDDQRKKLFIARDRFGIKPVYYFYDQSRFIFASEIKGIIADNSVSRELDYSAVLDFLVYRFIPSPKSIWKNIKKLPPAHFLEFSVQDNTLNIEKYWDISTAQNKVEEKEIVEKTDHLLQQSIKEHLVSDVPIGVFLSGGFDSSTLVYYMHKLGYPTQSFSIGFEGWGQSEHRYAKMVADQYQTKHYEYIIKESENIDNTEELMFYYDEPLGGSSFLPTYTVSKLASQEVKVIMAGDGGDEVFAGYNWYKSIIDTYRRKRALFKIKDRLNDTPYLLNAYYQAMSWAGFDYQSANQLFNDVFSESPIPEKHWLYRKNFDDKNGSLKALQLLDYHTFMPEVILNKVDRASMANSLEVRVPFLDHELTEMMMSLDEGQYYKKGKNKHILFEVIKNYFPKEILYKPKKGFGAPLGSVQEFAKMREVILGGLLLQHQIINQSQIEDYLKTKQVMKLWAVYILEMWYREWSSK